MVPDAKEPSAVKEFLLKLNLTLLPEDAQPEPLIFNAEVQEVAKRVPEIRFKKNVASTMKPRDAPKLLMVKTTNGALLEENPKDAKNPPEVKPLLLKEFLLKHNLMLLPEVAQRETQTA